VRESNIQLSIEAQNKIIQKTKRIFSISSVKLCILCLIFHSTSSLCLITTAAINTAKNQYPWRSSVVAYTKKVIERAINHAGAQIHFISGTLSISQPKNFQNKYHSRNHKNTFNKKESKNHCIPTSLLNSPAVKTASANIVNGNANQSFIQASHVRANLLVIAFLLVNFWIWTSEANTGSVGDNTADNNIAAGRPSHRNIYQNKNDPTRKIGIEIRMSLRITFQSLRV